LLQALWERQITAIAYEMIEEADDLLPILLPMSQIAGRLAPIVAGQLLTTIYRGRGILLSGLPGVPAAAVVILGGGVLGSNAARAFLGLGSQVTILDRDLGQLQRLDELFGNRINTMVANEYNIKRTTAFADVLVGAVLRSGRRAPVLVSRAMVRDMTPGSVIIDFSIDQGGCVATSRPTTLRDQYYVEEGVIHHCVPNFTAVTARTSSYAITNTVLSYLLAVAKDGLPEVFAAQPALRRGVNVYVGRLAHPEVAAALGRNVEVEVPGNAQDEENL
jgi:alanine dehydrogenase